MKLPTHKKFLSATAAASVLLLTAACGGGSDEPAGAAPTNSETSSAATDSASTGNYVDGVYEAEGSYSNPGGLSTVKVEVTLADGVISVVKVTPEATNGTSKGFQQKFASGIAPAAVGKSIDELDISKVSGSSLTSQGFNQAIDQIKADASA